MNNSEIFPHLHLLVSGGNSQILYLNNDFNSCQIIGQTLDDAAGECFDKIGRMLGLKYPAGVYLSKIAEIEDVNLLDFPVGMEKSTDLNLSYSGLKTFVRYLIQKNDLGFKFEESLSDIELEQLMKLSIADLTSEKLKNIKKICISTQHVIIKQLDNKIKLAIKKYPSSSLGLSGGVSANLLLRKHMSEIALKYTKKDLFLPHMSLTGDNAVMIGLAGIAQNC
jgi:N6-L-threonylcarbamoyladenine synthase